MTLFRLSLLGLLAVALLALQTPTTLRGAWRSTGAGPVIMLIASDDYLMQTLYEPNRWDNARGGTYRADGKLMQLAVEFDTQDSTRVGQTETYELNVVRDRLTLLGRGGRRQFQRIDDGTGPLAGLWRITGRANENGQLTTMQRGPRKTLKLLTGSRFQWAAINPETKGFFGTGGGTYTLQNGQYTETIDFFSRDNSRVGKALTFQADVTADTWRHTGKSSTGGPVDEVWSRETGR